MNPNMAGIYVLSSATSEPSCKDFTCVVPHTPRRVCMRFFFLKQTEISTCNSNSQYEHFTCSSSVTSERSSTVRTNTWSVWVACTGPSLHVHSPALRKRVNPINKDSVSSHRVAGNTHLLMKHCGLEWMQLQRQSTTRRFTIRLTFVWIQHLATRRRPVPQFWCFLINKSD